MDDLTPTSPTTGAITPRAAKWTASPVRAFGATHPGWVREGNEDAFLIAPELGLAVVADGVASGGGGAIAAETVVKAVRDYFRKDATQRALAGARPETLAAIPPLLLGASEEAHLRVREAAVTSGFVQMGTTVAVVLFVAGHAFVMHMGDSRVHRLRAGRLEQITEDHSALNLWIARHGPPTESVIAQLGHVIVRAVSACMSDVRPDIWVEPAMAGDLFLLSTDGLTKVVEEAAIQDIVVGAANLEMAALCLIDAALAGGGPDNVTAVLLRFPGKDLEECPETLR